MTDTTVSAFIHTTPPGHEEAYASLLTALDAGFRKRAEHVPVLFHTKACTRDLFGTFLALLPPDEQPVHTCNSCRQFMQSYGDLAYVVPETGELRSVMWHPAEVPAVYQDAVSAMAQMVESGPIEGLFATNDTTWGKPQTGDWRHMAVTAPAHLVNRSKVLTPGQIRAARRESLGDVIRGLNEFGPHLLDDALRILAADAVNMAERYAAPLTWLRRLHDRPKGRQGQNLLWLAVATAPEGYLHPRSAVTGTLLEDLAAGLPFETVRKRFNDKVHPLRHMRPQAAPTAGNIKAAEALVEKLGIAPSLERRYAKLEEVATFWWPTPAQPEAGKGGVFGHLKAKDSPPERRLDLPAQVMSWDKFQRTVLAVGVSEIEVKTPAHGAYLALLTAVHPDAPPIFKWDREDERNPVSWYVYPQGSPASQWGLNPNVWTKVTGIALLPPMAGTRPMPHEGQGVVIMLEGCRDQRAPSSALFPAMLRNELHAVRATIEAHSKSSTPSGRQEATACGLDMRNGGGAYPTELRVRNGSGWDHYRIDRWD